MAFASQHPSGRILTYSGLQRVFTIMAFASVAGVCETTMAEILGTVGQTAALNLTDAKGATAGVGEVFVRMDEVEHQHDLVTLKLRAQHVSFLFSISAVIKFCC